MSKTKYKEPMATVNIRQLSPSTKVLVECKLVDSDDVEGVSYSPKRRKWRAYVHIGKRQVFHKWCDGKLEAIEERRKAMVTYQQSTAKTSGGPPFPRKIRAPRYRNLDRTLQLLDNAMIGMRTYKCRIQAFGLKKNDAATEYTNGEMLGLKIGEVIALVDLLVLDGAVKAEDIDTGMAEMVEQLEEVYL